MKIRKITLILLIVFSMLLTTGTYVYALSSNENNYEIIYVDNLESISDDEIFYQESKEDSIVFYVDNAIKNQKKQNSNILETFKNNIYENDEIDNVSLKLVSKYKLYISENEINGELYAYETISLDEVSNKLNSIVSDYYNGSIQKSYQTKIITNHSLSVEKDWIMLKEVKVDAILDYKNTYYASFSEWRTSYKLNSSNKTHDYFAFVNETYIKPNTYKTDFRTDELVYKFDPTIGAKTELRDYQPKSKPPSETISYSVSVSGEIAADGNDKISSTISNSYSTLKESPKVHDQGNMLKNYAEIRMDYLEPFANQGIYYDYNIGQSYQSSAFIIKAQKLNQDIIINDDRDVTIVRDGFWSNSIITFKMKSKITILR